MYGALAYVQSVFASVVAIVSAKPEIFINAIGFVAAIVTYIVRSRKDLRLQHRNNYFKLELEASRIFTVALQNPDIPRFLRGDLDHDPKSSDPRLHEQVFWFVSQELNIFEIAISLRNEKTITSELFATWVPWFYELGTYRHFRSFWAQPYDLMYHYKPELQEIMTAAMELKASPDFDEDDPETMGRFCEKVAEIFGDREILRQYRRTVHRNRRLESRMAAAAPVRQPVRAM